jgi:hypothetical protein
LHIVLQRRTSIARSWRLNTGASRRQPVEAQINAFLAKYSPEVSAQLSAARSHLRALFPRGHELVYENYNALVFGFSPTEHTPDAFLSVAGYPRWVTLFFFRGVNLHDPHDLLQGSGSQVRSIRLRSAQHLMEPEVEALIAQAILPHREALLRAAPLQTIVKSVSGKQRARRPAERPSKNEHALQEQSAASKAKRTKL